MIYEKVTCIVNCKQKHQPNKSLWNFSYQGFVCLNKLSAHADKKVKMGLIKSKKKMFSNGKSHYIMNESQANGKVIS